MKILTISHTSPEISIGGIERYIQNLFHFCPDRPYETFILLPSSGKKSVEKKKNMTVLRKDFLRFDYKEIYGKKVVSHSQIQQKAKEFFLFLQKFLKEEKIDIVNAQGFSSASLTPFSIALHMACFNNNISCVEQVHRFPEREIDKALIKDLPWKKLICVSKSVAGDLFSKGIDIEKIETIYLGVDTNEFNQNLDRKWLKKSLKLPEKTKLVLHASRITDGKKSILKEKGIITLLESMSKLCSDPDLKLLIATATPPAGIVEEFNRALDELKSYIKLYNLDGQVICKIFSLAEMPKVYAGSDIFAMVSESETLGQVFLEAMACGVPVIGTNVGGVPEIIVDRVSGFLISPNDASSLSQRIEEILNNQALRESFISSGLERVNNIFSAEKQFTALFNYLETLK